VYFLSFALCSLSLSPFSPFSLSSFCFLSPGRNPPQKKVQNKEKIGARWVLVMVAWQAWALWMGLEVFGVQRWLMYHVWVDRLMVMWV
jgi:hypothetical protein